MILLLELYYVIPYDIGMVFTLSKSIKRTPLYLILKRKLWAPLGRLPGKKTQLPKSLNMGHWRVIVVCEGWGVICHQLILPHRVPVIRNFYAIFIFIWYEQVIEQTIQLPVIWDAMTLMSRRCNMYMTTGSDGSDVTELVTLTLNMDDPVIQSYSIRLPSRAPSLN